MAVLSDIRVLDFGRFIAGPYCGALLGDLGAEVIRVEKIDGSEDRHVAPVAQGGPGSVFLQVNRNKLGFTLNPRSLKGQEILKQLVATADVLIANLPPKTLNDMGLDYGSLCKYKPDIILTTSTAYGSSGPYEDRIGFDGVAQAMSGNMHLTGYSEEPMKNYAPYVDYITACMNALATVVAILHRHQTGKGQHVQGCLLASALTAMGGPLTEQALLQLNRQASGNRGQTAAPADTYSTKDGFILVQVVGSPLFRRWAELMGEPDWLADERFATDQSRAEHSNLITARMQQWTSKLTTVEAVAQLSAARIPCGEVLDPQGVLDNEQVEAMGFFKEIFYPGIKDAVPVTSMPMQFSTIENGIRFRAPTLGEHTDQILTDIGYGPEEIEEFRSSHIV